MCRIWGNGVNISLTSVDNYVHSKVNEGSPHTTFDDNCGLSKSNEGIPCSTSIDQYVQAKGDVWKKHLMSPDRTVQAESDTGSPRPTMIEQCAQATADMCSPPSISVERRAQAMAKACSEWLMFLWWWLLPLSYIAFSKHLVLYRYFLLLDDTDIQSMRTHHDSCVYVLVDASCHWTTLLEWFTLVIDDDAFCGVMLY